MTTVLAWVDCPDCGNTNRHTRRRCKATGGMCGGTGVVQKYVPDEEANEGRVGFIARVESEDSDV